MPDGALSRSISCPTFDWENIDWMPTPVGQAKIPSPWVGQGSIVKDFGVDIVNDRKASDGWVLLYNVFTDEGEQPLNNPYFILYNKYRGLMRVFLYTTTQFVTPSSYIQDGISIIGTQSNMMNFMGTDLIDGTLKQSDYSQIQPFKLTTNRWYMFQYEIAYDPEISKIPYNNVQMNWYANYYNVQQISLGGDIKGEIVGTIGVTGNNIFSDLKGVGRTVGTGTVAAIGKDFFTNHAINISSGENSLGLSPEVFKNISEGLSKAISSSTSSLPSKLVNVLSGILGGSSNGTYVNLTLNATIDMEGTGTESGSLPSTPISFWVPGTTIPVDAPGYLPLYNESLGVFNFVGKPIVDVVWTKRWKCYPEAGADGLGEMFDSFEFYPSVAKSFIKINPAVQKIANVTTHSKFYVIHRYPEARNIHSIQQYSGKPIPEKTIYGDMYEQPEKINSYVDFQYKYDQCENYEEIKELNNKLNNPFLIVCQIVVTVKPKDGSPVSTITKTFYLEPRYTRRLKLTQTERGWKW